MFKFISTKEQIIRQQKKAEQLNARQNEVDVVNSIAFVTLAESGSIDEVTATEHTNLFAEWVAGVSYTVSALRQYNGQLYRCVQAHTAQADWTPDVAISLWSKAGNPNQEYPSWSQPVGAHDAYNTGDKVTYNQKKWISTTDGNVWEPGVYGWEQVLAEKQIINNAANLCIIIKT